MRSLEQARQVLAGQSFSTFLGAEMVRCDAAGVVIELALRDEFKQNNGFAHGGVLAYLADVGLAFAVGQQIGAPIVTAEIKINYLRPAIGERLIARATALSVGRMQGVSRCNIFVVSGGGEKLCAAAQGTMLRLPDRPSQ